MSDNREEGVCVMIVTIDQISETVNSISSEYGITKASLFGSYADGTCTDDSDIDLLIEFTTPSVSLFKISGLKIRLEEIFSKQVDIIHAPLPKDSMIEIESERVIYEAS